MSKLLLSLGLLSMLACSSFTVRAPDQGLGDEGGSMSGVGRDRPRSTANANDTRQTCRTNARPSGWIAVSYLQLGNQCQKTDDDPYNGVLLQRYSTRPVGSVLDICADQVVPRGWHRISQPTSAACAGAHVKEGEPTAIRILKHR